MSNQPELPQLEYPLLYTFRIIGTRSATLREHVRTQVQAVVGVIPDDAVTERESAKGNYLAVHVSCLLTSEDQRRGVYARFHGDPRIKLAL